MLRDLAYIFIYRDGSGLSLIAKLCIPISIMLFLALAIRVGHIGVATLQILSIFIIEILILIYIGSLKRIASAIMLIAIFITAGLSIRLISAILGYEPVKLEDMVISTLRVAGFFIAMTIMFQWIKISEYQWIFKKLKLEGIAILLTVTLTQISAILIAYSEALTTIRLKYGGRALQKVVKPLIIYSINYGRDFAEAMYMYGIPEPHIDISMRGVDVMLSLGISIILIFLGTMLRNLY